MTFHRQLMEKIALELDANCSGTSINSENKRYSVAENRNNNHFCLQQCVIIAFEVVIFHSLVIIRNLGQRPFELFF
ncbi:hypothetical protein BpHYR1_006390 [Brachionus plicatilis]|uniref:Uncharacterized protein n=1 Tax=Brachionus plicatilis TaxID=10195 RepID=A0A3M7R6E8_BRAPC|nr:hypothetical protein BpHYR1_006390 [Brachionus plicatilis]